MSGSSKSSFNKWINGVRALFGRGRGASNKSTAETPDSTGLAFELGGAHIVFGMNWVPGKADQVRGAHEQARNSGMRSTVRVGDLLGFSMENTHVKDAKKPSLSGALVLADGASAGDSEIFVFGLPDGQYALVALQDSMPVPGFDLVGDLGTIKSAANNYLRLPHRTTVRQCGSRDVLDEAEYFNLETVLGDSDYVEARLKKIGDRAKIIRVALIVLAIAGSLGAGYVYMENQKRLAEQERLAREGDPELLYERSFAEAQKKIGLMGVEGLQAMLTTAQRIPLIIGGWTLSQVKCNFKTCTATWTRRYGSYTDFEADIPADVKVKPNYGVAGKPDKSPDLETVYSVDSQEKVKTLSELRGSFPLKSLAQMDFGSQLQDYGLVKVTTSMGDVSLFGNAEGVEIAGVFRPVLAGAWSASGELWQLDSFQIPDYAVVESLQILNIGPLDKKALPTYTMSGQYFVKGKNFK